MNRAKSIFSFRNVARSTAVLTLMFLQMFATSNLSAQPDGKALFNANCAACHKIDKKFVGPPLLGARERWETNSTASVYDWVQNSPAVLKSGDKYANKLLKEYNGAAMTAQSLSNEEIDAVFEYVASAPPPPPPPPAGGEENPENTKDEGSLFIWLIVGIVALVIVMAVGGVRRQLNNAVREKEGLAPVAEDSYMKSLLRWSSRHKILVGLFVVFITVLGTNDLLHEFYSIGVQEGYHPEQPINFPHDVHAGLDEIDCQYCHSGASKSKHAGIPSVNVCMNCHKGIQESSISGEAGTKEIQKIYDAAGFDTKSQAYTGKTKPIKWVKVHNLPDHVYFPHDQHVVAGGLDCKNCHGDMTKEKTARVMTVEELSAVEGNIKLTKPTLTMGWCIECHGEAEVQMDGVAKGYYDEIHERLKKDPELLKKIKEDKKYSVRELGGWECAKCHY